jgi:hypothetical protein
LKENIFVTPIIRGPNWSLHFHISTYASDTASGAMLGQEENKISYAIYFVIKSMTPP